MKKEYDFSKGERGKYAGKVEHTFMLTLSEEERKDIGIALLELSQQAFEDGYTEASERMMATMKKVMGVEPHS
jgi:hypothetical protein